MANFVNMSEFEMAIIEPMAQVGNSGMWSCRLCQARYDNIIPLITHLLRTCPLSTTASPFNTISTSSVVNICAHVDPVGSMPMLESYQRVYGAEHTGSNDKSVEHQTSSAIGHGRIELGDDDVEMQGEDEADTQGDEETDTEESGDGLDNTGQQGLHTFPPTPPDHLSEADKKSYRFWQCRSSRIRDIMVSNRKPSNGAVEMDTAVAAWNATYGWMPQYSRYGKFPALSSRMSRDKGFLRRLVGRGA